MIVLNTNYGAIKVELDFDKAPNSAENFLQYAKSGFYDGTIFHRVIDNFMIQGGGFQVGMMEKDTREPIENEAKNGLSNETGTIAMARTMDPHSASAQFFINVRNNLRLDWTPGQQGYAVFGEVIEGMEVVDAISTTPTTRRGEHADTPTMPVVIERAYEVDASSPGPAEPAP